MDMLTIALIGRTNVGKSTLFNRIIGAARAIVSELPHTTRDRNVGTTAWRGVELRVIDTGGVEGVKEVKDVKDIQEEIRSQAQRAISDADLLILVTDVRDGLLPGEQRISRELRRLGKPIIVACNKASTERLRIACQEFSALALGPVSPIAAITGAGVGDLLDRIVGVRREARGVSKTNDTSLTTHDSSLTTHDSRLTTHDSRLTTRMAIVGEPNVGKSSLLNAILGRDEVIVLPEPFTTRDVHDVELEVELPIHPQRYSLSEPQRVEGRAGVPSTGPDDSVSGSRPKRRDSGTIRSKVVLLDTAGIRRLAVRAVRTSRTRIEEIERLAVRRSLAAIERSDVVILVLDATRPASKHTKQLAQAIIDAGRACVIVVNKMDLTASGLSNSATEQLSNVVHRQFPHLQWAPVLLTSAITGEHVSDIVPTAIRSAEHWRRQLEAPELAAVHATVKRRIPVARTSFGRKRSHVVELRQTDTAPPWFLLLSRKRIKLPKAIPSIVERAIREHADFSGTPIRITIKSVKA